jgi:K+-sensing histidine kinase KdpD
MKENAKYQSDFMMQFSNELKHNISDLYAFFLANKSEIANRDQVQKRVNGLMAKTLELGSIVEDKLDYANIKSGDFKLQETVYNIRSVIELKIREFADQEDKSANHIKLHISDDVPDKLVGDPTRIGSIIGKLLEGYSLNSDEGGFSIEVGAKKRSYSTDLEIRAHDESYSIGKKRAEYIHSYLTSRGISDVRDEELDATGFPLVGYHINAMSGQLEVHSDSGQGTEFLITIPQLEVRGGGV